MFLFLFDNKMESFATFLRELRSVSYLNIILFTNRIRAEWYSGSAGDFTLLYPVEQIFHSENGIETATLNQDPISKSWFTEYLSVDFSMYPTFIKVYSIKILAPECEQKHIEFVLADIGRVHKFLDTRLKMINYEDFDLKFRY